MSFTNEDFKELLKRSIIHGAKGYEMEIDSEKVIALLARLEASERYIQKQRNDEDCLELFYKAWLNSKGECKHEAVNRYTGICPHCKEQLKYQGEEPVESKAEWDR